MHLSCRRRTLTQNTWQYSRYFNFDFNNDGLFFGMSKKYLQFRKQQMHMSRKICCLPFVWLDLLTPELFFELCMSQGYIQNFQGNWKNSVCIRAINFAKSVNFMGVFTKKKLKLSKPEYYSLCGKVNFCVIHPIHISIYSF